MITERKTVRKTASSAVDGVGKSIDAGAEVVKNTNSVDHWDFLDQIEAPMWTDLTLCNDDIDDSWFDISHQFHQWSSSQLLSTIFHPNTTSIQEPPSPKLPPSVSKSRGKNYKTKSWTQRNKPTSNNQHPLKTLTMKSSKNTNPTSNKAPKVSSSCESGLTNTSRPKISKSSLCSSLSSREQEQEGSAMSTVTSNHTTSNHNQQHQEKKILEVSCKTLNQTSDLLTSLRNNFRRSCITRPAKRVVADNGRCSEGFKYSSSKSSEGSSSKGINVISVSQPLRNKLIVPNVTKTTSQVAQSLSNRKVSNTLASKVTTKGKVQQHTSVGKVLIERKVNEQNKMIDKKVEKRGNDRCAPILAGVKKTASLKIGACEKGISSDTRGYVQKDCKQNVAQKNGSKKLIGVKEKTNNRSRDNDNTVNPTRKVYFR